MVSMNKQYRTRDGRKVRILANDFNTNYPIVAAVTEVENNTEYEVIKIYSNKGTLDIDFTLPTTDDLVEVTPYDHINEGDLVMVWDLDNSQYGANLTKFGGVDENKKPLDDNKTSWDCCLTVQEYADKYL